MQVSVFLDRDILSARRGSECLVVEFADIRAGSSLIGHLLCLCDLRELPIVEHEPYGADIIRSGRHGLEPGHQERAVPDDADDLPFRQRHLDGDGRRHAVAHTVEIGWREIVTAFTNLHELGGQECVVAVVGYHDGVIAQL